MVLVFATYRGEQSASYISLPTACKICTGGSGVIIINHENYRHSPCKVKAAQK